MRKVLILVWVILIATPIYLNIGYATATLWDGICVKSGNPDLLTPAEKRISVNGLFLAARCLNDDKNTAYGPGTISSVAFELLVVLWPITSFGIPLVGWVIHWVGAGAIYVGNGAYYYIFDGGLAKMFELV